LRSQAFINGVGSVTKDLRTSVPKMIGN